ncbi:hypothetical protein [Tenacibaculum sp.]|uniref:hypothetical protein n=1 Tax=Tenacibaculum sp. TaxID=1906242 RepID=UPI003AA8F134
MYTNDGNPLVIVNFAKDKIKSELNKQLNKTIKKGAIKVVNKANTKIKTTTNNISIAKLEKGFLVASRGRIHTKKESYIAEIFLLMVRLKL